MGAGKTFSAPISLEIDGRRFEIINLADAGDLLLNNWPIDTTRRRAAMRSIMLALRGQGDIALARKLFIAAAIEIFAFRGD
jgi:hypothetical protein